MIRRRTPCRRRRPAKYDKGTARAAGAAARAHCRFGRGATCPPERYYQFTEGCSFRVRRR